MAVELKRKARVPKQRQQTTKERLAPTDPAQPSVQDERLLVQRVKAGDQQALEILYRRFGSRVYRQAIALVGNEAEAEEIMQDVFLTLYEKANTFRGDAAFSTWFFRLTVNAALTRLRRRRRNREVPFDDYLPKYQPDGHHLVQPVVDWSNDLEKRLGTKELRRILHQALDQLSPVDKSVVVLSDLEGISNREIGEALGLTVPAVKTRLHRARLFLRGKLAVTLGHSPY